MREENKDEGGVWRWETGISLRTEEVSGSNADFSLQGLARLEQSIFSYLLLFTVAFNITQRGAPFICQLVIIHKVANVTQTVYKIYTGSL